MTRNENITHSIKKWLQTVIIQLNFCPFAGKEFMRESIHYEIVNHHLLEKYLERFLLECKRLDSTSEIETTLIIFPEKPEQPDSFDVSDFDNFLTLVSLVEQLIINYNYEGIYQVATFHPDYIFEGSDESDPANYTNRSPYPILHILREESLEQAIVNHKDAEGIPSRNIALAQEMGLEKMKELLLSCIK